MTTDCHRKGNFRVNEHRSSVFVGNGNLYVKLRLGGGAGHGNE